ncbi:MAG TPA: FtsX-like permease family protein, partial [Beijerinckiaceae bacterium]|nr:FtsX-like permease family protein [Beijerinckiaceae bacterium]
MRGQAEAVRPTGLKRLSAWKAPLVRIAGRELRGGLRGFGIFLACIALGVAAIVGVTSISSGFSDGLAREGRRILGGDASFSLIHREITPTERAFLSARGSISAIATLRAMARRPGGSSALVELKAVDSTWPSQGAAVIKPDHPLAGLLARRNGAYGLVADPALAARLGLSMGDRLKIGESVFALRGTLLSEPDTLAGSIGLGPRVIITQDALRSSALLQPGSLVRWTYRVTLRGSPAQPVSDAKVSAFTHAAEAAFPAAGWEVRTRSNVSPQFATSLRQLTEFLTLVGLTSLIVGGVGVANAVRSFVERKRADFATFKSLGATGGAVFLLSLMEVMAVAGLGVTIGLLLGALMPYVVAWGFGRFIPLPFIPAVYPGKLAAGALYGVLTALAFSIAPLGGAHDVPVSALFRDRLEPDRPLPRARYIVFVGAAAIALVSAMVVLASDQRIAWIYILATLVGFLLLRAIAWLMMALARRAPRMRGTELRLALANIHRPGALTPSIVLSLGLGLALLVALTFIDGNLRREIGKAVPGETPSLFFLDVPSAQTQTFDAFVHAKAPGVKL